MPIRPWSPHLNSLRPDFTSLGVRLLDSSDFTKLLGVFVGPTQSSSYQFDQLLTQFHQRAFLWRWRSHTLRDCVLLLRTVILPILWHVGAIIYFSNDQLARLRPIVHNFVHNKTTIDLPTSSSPGQLNESWHSVSPSLGGLGLPSVTATLRSIRRSILVQALCEIHRFPGRIPHWFSPIPQLFSYSRQEARVGLDILYIPTPPPVTLNSTKWKHLPASWFDTLRLWCQHFLPPLSSHHRTPTQQLCQPLWLNKLLCFGTAQLPLMRTITTSHHLRSQHVYRLLDFPADTNGIPTSDSLRLFFHSRTKQINKVVTTLLLKLNLIVLQFPLAGTFRPIPPTNLLGAFDAWNLVTLPLHRITTNLILQQIEHPAPPTTPFSRLGIPDEHLPLSLTTTFWPDQQSLNRYLLPVCSDLVFRLLHNAIGCRYKYQWRTQVHLSTHCVHGCKETETPRHLFWDCPIARILWSFYLKPFDLVYSQPLDWTRLLFYTDLRLKLRYQTKSCPTVLLPILHFLRGCVLRTLWLHRNHRLYNNSAYVLH